MSSSSSASKPATATATAGAGVGDDEGVETVFITGGTGFLGREVVLRLSAAHPRWRLHVFDLAAPSAELLAVANARYTVGDMLSGEAVSAALASSAPSCVVHVAGMVTPLAQRYGKRLRDLVWRVNVEGTRTVLAAARRQASVRAFVYTGSCCAVIDDFRHAYPNVDESWATSPSALHNTIYGESKAVAEAEVLAANDSDGTGTAGGGDAAAAAVAGQLASQLGAGAAPAPARRRFLTCSLRPSTLFGDTDSQLLEGIHGLIGSGETPFVIGDGLNLWDVCHAANVADAHVLACENLLLSADGRAGGQAFFIGNEEPIPFRTFCCAVWREFGHVPPFEVTVPTGLAWAVGLLAEAVSWISGRDPGLRRASVADATAVRYADGRKAREILGYRARLSLHDGIHRSCQLYKQRLEERAREAQVAKTR